MQVKENVLFVRLEYDPFVKDARSLFLFFFYRVCFHPTHVSVKIVHTSTNDFHEIVFFFIHSISSFRTRRYTYMYLYVHISQMNLNICLYMCFVLSLSIRRQFNVYIYKNEII